MSAEKRTSSKRQQTPNSSVTTDALRRFVRARATAFLADPNITSVGVGHKIVDGTTTDQVAVQFTVREKVSPESLESLGTALLPESLDVEGFDVPTDVVERAYELSYRIVDEADTASSTSKTRHDPIRPGVSVGHVDVSAGTIGAIVYDRNTGAPLVLSNWHVLHGPEGKLRDDVVQPGAYDDDRVEANRMGRLYRSHLGVAGDCAVATIDGRGNDPSILDIDVAPTELGDPELGDKVIKNGRTTGVTHGIVRRIDTVVKLDYGGSYGEQAIGCFEIGPDKNHPAGGNGISDGGDSGAVWMFKARNGRTSTVLAGLHFGGDANGSADDHALACLGPSVFTKLDITLNAPAVTEEQAASESRIGAGYDAEFLGTAVDTPTIDAGLRDDLVTVEGSPIVTYTHFSLAQSESRRFARWVAWNIDGGNLQSIDRSSSSFTTDPRLPKDVQVDNDLYASNRIDRGHIARRADLTWGSQREAEQANDDSFFYTNIAPQMDDFNQSARQGIWGLIENAVLNDAGAQDLKVSVFGGPVFAEDDRVYRGVALPREFFKIVVFVAEDTLTARAFLLTQNLNRLESLELDEFRTYQVNVSTIEERTQLGFAAALHNADDYRVTETVGGHPPLQNTRDVVW